MAVDLLAPFRDEPAACAILLDVDGTLAPIVDHPDLSRVPEETLALLEQLVERYALVACVSGRAAADCARLVPVQGIAFVGNHGLERLQDGVVALADGVVEWLPVVAATARTLEPIATSLGGWVEDKGATLTVHVREAPDPDGALIELERCAVPLITAAGLGWRLGRMSLEARPPLHLDKGTAVETLLAAHPGIVHALYAGDDSTDADALRVVDVGIAVASEETPPDLLAAAHLTVMGPAGLADLLRSLLDSR